MVDFMTKTPMMETSPMSIPNMRIFSPYLRLWLLTLSLSALSFGNAAWANPDPAQSEQQFLQNQARLLEGEWIGDYGPNGLEQIQVTVVGNIIIAVKITGDPYVPAGNATWWGSLDTREVSWHISRTPGGELETTTGRIWTLTPDRMTIEMFIDGQRQNLDFRRPGDPPPPKPD